MRWQEVKEATGDRAPRWPTGRNVTQRGCAWLGLPWVALSPAASPATCRSVVALRGVAPERVVPPAPNAMPLGWPASVV